LHKKIALEGFPKPVKAAPYTQRSAAYYRRSDVIAWDAERKAPCKS
jgi:hypothetical protein